MHAFGTDDGSESSKEKWVGFANTSDPPSSLGPKINFWEVTVDQLFGENKQQHLSPNDVLLAVMSRLLNQTHGAWGDLLDGRRWASDWGVTLNTGLIMKK